MTPTPPLGATPDGDGVTFAVWSPCARSVQVRAFADGERAIGTHDLRGIGGGRFAARVSGARPGSLYKFVLDERELPDPYARFLPFGVHGPAEVIERRHASPAAQVPPLGRMVIYELHVGTFTPEGTYAAASERLTHLVELGVTTVELMPLSSFPGQRGWGYDGVAHFAPFAPYGRPDDLREFVARAHACGLTVLLDAVYNHFGPRGNYLGSYAAEYFHRGGGGNPWGDTPDFTTQAMREYVLSNARMWFEEYGFDGLRLDATHTLHDPSPTHILAELRALAASYAPAKVLVAEDDRNNPSILRDTGLDAVWADDFHHQMRVVLTGERDGYYAAYEPSIAALARTIERGWQFEGQHYPPWGRPRGVPADDLPPERFVYCVENHDQIGNRALGERLSVDAGEDALLAATLILLFLPMTPLLFMGQEWAASSPFQFFTDHDPEYWPVVSRGRREEFRSFAAFASDDARARIPDPQSLETFERSKLRWDELARGPHRRVAQAVQSMLALRRTDPVLMYAAKREAVRATARGGLLVVDRHAPTGRRRLVANLSQVAHAWDELATPKRPMLAVGDVAGASLSPFALGIWG